MIDGVAGFSLELLKGAFIAGAVFAAIRGEFRLMKFRLNDVKEEVGEIKTGLREVNTRIDIHLDKGH